MIPLLPIEAWRDLVDAHRRVSVAEGRRWSNAALVARGDAGRIAASLAQRLAEAARLFEAGPSPPPVQRPRDILADLIALEREFAEVALDLKGQTLALTTDPVALEGVDLGRFRIVLRWDELPDAGAYDVVALDPHPAASDESTTHPHVRDEVLCEGEGRTPIRRALEDGRLYDFFLLVRQVLATYNPGSAYVPLSRWSGNPCDDCGHTPDADDATSCERCGGDLCFDCSIGCTDCGRTCCSDCRDRCGGCQESYCPSCLSACRDCGESCCRSCLADRRCGDCRDSDEPDDTTLPHEEHNDHDLTVGPISDAEDKAAAMDAAEETVAAGAAVHALCLGEAAVPA